MGAQFLFIFFTIILLVAILVLFVIKAGLQLQYLKLEKGKKPGAITDFLQFDFSDKKERIQRWKAFLLFPMLYAIILDDKKESLNEIKKKVKRIHIFIYIALIILIILAVYSEKVFV